MKKLLFIAMLGLLAFSFIGCGQKTTLVISSSFVREIYEKEEYVDYIFEAFEEEHGVEIQLDTYDDTGVLFNKIDTEQQSDNVVTDLLIAHYSDMVNYIDGNEYVLDLSALEAEMTDRTFSDAFNASTNRGNTRYFFPINTDLYLAIAHNDAFDAANLPAGKTEADILAGDYTWDDYVAWASGPNVMTAIKGQSAKLLIYQVGGMALSHTDTVAGTFPNLNSDANKTAWADILAMYDAGGIHGESTTVNDLAPMLQDGRIQLAYAHMNQIATVMENASANFKVFPGPKGDSGKAGTIIGGHGIAVVAGSENEELAKEFVKWITAPDQIVHAALGSVPPLAEAVSALGDSPADQIIKMGIETLTAANVEGLQMIPLYTDWGLVKGCSDDVFTEIMAGNVADVAALNALLDTQQAALEALVKPTE